MISNQILQNTIEGLKGISRIDFCVLDTEGKALATTFEDTWNYESAVLSFVESPADSQVIQGCQFFKIFDEQQLEYVLLAGGESEDVYMLGKIAAFQVQSLLVAYKERFDKDNSVSYTHLRIWTGCFLRHPRQKVRSELPLLTVWARLRWREPGKRRMN